MDSLAMTFTGRMRSVSPCLCGTEIVVLIFLVTNPQKYKKGSRKFSYLPCFLGRIGDANF